MKTIMLILGAVLLGFPIFAAEPPPLEKNEAGKILQAMEWKEVTVVAVLQGVDAKGATASIYATIIGLGTRDQKHQRICQTMYYDRELGWFLYEIEDKRARIWSKSGYREIRPWVTW